MGVLILVLGLITVFTITMAGAIAGLMGQLPEQSFLSILAHYLRRDSDYAKGMTRPEGIVALARLKRFLTISAAGFAGGGIVALAGGLSTDCRAAYASAVALGVLALNLAVVRVVVASWMKRLSR